MQHVAQRVRMAPRAAFVSCASLRWQGRNVRARGSALCYRRHRRAHWAERRNRKYRNQRDQRRRAAFVVVQFGCIERPHDRSGVCICHVRFEVRAPMRRRHRAAGSRRAVRAIRQWRTRSLYEHVLTRAVSLRHGPNPRGSMRPDAGLPRTCGCHDAVVARRGMRGVVRGLSGFGEVCRCVRVFLQA